MSQFQIDRSCRVEIERCFGRTHTLIMPMAREKLTSAHLSDRLNCLALTYFKLMLRAAVVTDSQDRGGWASRSALAPQLLPSLARLQTCLRQN
jgi:hypothetical protein